MKYNKCKFGKCKCTFINTSGVKQYYHEQIQISIQHARKHLLGVAGMMSTLNFIKYPVKFLYF
jgi:hypothetical protein